MRTESNCLSIIVPICLPDRYVGNLSDWFSQEDFSDVEVIIVHDIRPGASSRVLFELAQKYTNIRIQILEGVFGSPGLARNAGLKVARGVWVSFCDADDFQYVNRIVLAIRHKPYSGIVVGQFQRISISGKALRRRPTFNCRDLIIDPGFWRIIYKRELVQQIEFSDFRVGEDVVFVADVLRLGPQIVFLTDIFYAYRVGRETQNSRDYANFVDLDRAKLSIMTSNPSWKDNRIDSEFICRLACTQMRYELRNGNIRNFMELLKLVLQNSRFVGFIFLTYLRNLVKI